MNKVELIKTEAESLLKKMVDSSEIEVTEDEGVAHVVIKTEADAPTIIGRHGETIRALQKILEVIVYKASGESTQILVNVNDYREKQKERLQGIASELAQRARDEKRPTHFRGLSSYERKLIHEYITQEFSDLTTYSVGEGRERHLVIDLKSNHVDHDAAED